jgi:hypothetical protein
VIGWIFCSEKSFNQLTNCIVMNITKAILFTLAFLAAPSSQLSVPFLAPVNHPSKNAIDRQFIVVTSAPLQSASINFQVTPDSIGHSSHSFADINGIQLLSTFDFPRNENGEDGEVGGVSPLLAEQPLQGFVAKITDKEALESLRRHKDVVYIEQDQRVFTSTEDIGKAVNQKNATWGLQRISQHDKLKIAESYQYRYSNSAGEGVDVYVIDTGINIQHQDFQGRAQWGITVPVNDRDRQTDDNGHGTHDSGWPFRCSKESTRDRCPCSRYEWRRNAVRRCQRRRVDN